MDPSGQCVGAGYPPCRRPPFRTVGQTPPPAPPARAVCGRQFAATFQKTLGLPPKAPRACRLRDGMLPQSLRCWLRYAHRGAAKDRHHQHRAAIEFHPTMRHRHPRARRSRAGARVSLLHPLVRFLTCPPPRPRHWQSLKGWHVTQPGGTRASASVVSRIPSGPASSAARSIARRRAIPALARSAGGTSRMLTGKGNAPAIRLTTAALSSVQLSRQMTTPWMAACCCAASASRQPSISSASFLAGMAIKTEGVLSRSKCAGRVPVSHTLTRPHHRAGVVECSLVRQCAQVEWLHRRAPDPMRPLSCIRT